MNPILLAGVVIVNLALLAYTAGIVLEQRRRVVTRGALAFLVAGVVFDVAATLCMILGTERSLWTLHGLLGYSALAVMVTDTILIGRHRRREGDGLVPRGLHLYSRLAYAWWVIAYVTGALLVAMSRR
jgi:hypothetical protein